MDTGCILRGELNKYQMRFMEGDYVPTHRPTLSELRGRVRFINEERDRLREEQVLSTQEAERERTREMLKCFWRPDVSYRGEPYKSNTVVKGGSTMSIEALDLDKKLEVGDLLVGECRCNPSKKGVIEVLEVIEIPTVYDARIKLPCGGDLYTVPFGSGATPYPPTVKGVIDFIEREDWNTCKEIRRDYHNWKHIPKRDFTFEVGDILYGECACTPSKFVVFEVYDKESIRVVDCWERGEVGNSQVFVLSSIKSGKQTLNEHLHSILAPIYSQYNYTKYTKAEWAARCQAKAVEEQRSTTKFIDAKEWTPQDWTRRGFSDGPYTFKKSDYKVTETDKEIRVAPRPKYAGGVVSIQRVEGCAPQEVSFKVKEDEVEMFFFDIKTLISKYKDEQ